MRPATASRACSHALAVWPANDDDDVVVVAELVEVFLPALLTVLLGTEEVVARSLVTEAERGGDDRQGTQENGGGQHAARKAANRADQGEQTVMPGPDPRRGLIGKHASLPLPVPCGPRPVGPKWAECRRKLDFVQGEGTGPTTVLGCIILAGASWVAIPEVE